MNLGTNKKSTENSRFYLALMLSTLTAGLVAAPLLLQMFGPGAVDPASEPQKPYKRSFGSAPPLGSEEPVEGGIGETADPDSRPKRTPRRSPKTNDTSPTSRTPETSPEEPLATPEPPPTSIPKPTTSTSSTTTTTGDSSSSSVPEETTGPPNTVTE